MEKKERPYILVVNDDGIHAPGIRFLIECMSEVGEVVVVAPDSPMSGQGHSITINTPLRVTEMSNNGIMEYSCNGTPVDCVKLAKHKLLKRKPDLLVSGINHGSNSSVNIIYSGTMAAALEGAMNDIPSIGFSLLDYSLDADFSPFEDYVKEISNKVITEGLPKGICLNVNFPKVAKEAIKGVMVCRQASACWREEFDERTDPHQRKYYWLTGVFRNKDSGTDTDEWALANNYISIVPVQFDFTAYSHMDEFKKWSFND